LLRVQVEDDRPHPHSDIDTTKNPVGGVAADALLTAVLIARSLFSGSQGQRQPSENELNAARFQGEHVGRTTAALVEGRKSARK
jgi:hypothetical protein